MSWFSDIGDAIKSGVDSVDNVVNQIPGVKAVSDAVGTVTNPVLETIGDIDVGTLDTLTNVVGLKVIPTSWYSSQSAANLVSQIKPYVEAGANIAANIFLPGSGAVLSGAQTVEKTLAAPSSNAQSVLSVANNSPGAYVSGGSSTSLGSSNTSSVTASSSSNSVLVFFGFIVLFLILKK